MFMLAPVLNQL